MNSPIDIFGNPIMIGDRVAVAFSYSQASVGYLRIGTVEEIDAATARSDYDVNFKVRWEEDNKLSPKMKYGRSSRWMVL